MASEVKVTPAPYGGWNTRDSLADMPPHHAVLLDNWFPTENEVMLRKGYSSHGTTLGGQVETIAEFHSGSTQRLLAFANGNIWNCTTAGAGSSLASGLTNNVWDWVMFDGKMGMCNGADTPRQYDGTTVSTLTITGSGLTSSNLKGCATFKGRSFWWEDNSQDFWYSSLNTLGGALTKFPLSRVGTFGGKLLRMVTWTRDGGEGVDDFAVFLMSTGEVIVYAGSDPGFDWTLVGVYRIGQPEGSRCAIKVGGDVVIITREGYVSLAARIGNPNSRAISDQIADASRQAVATFTGNSGWQPIFWPEQRMLLVNVPTGTNQAVQHVYNTTTGAPCRFTDIDANCWGVYNGSLYFGGNATIYKFWDTLSDNGSAIVGDMIPAYQMLGRGSLVRATALQPRLRTSGSLQLALEARTDFDNGGQPSASLSTGNATTPWGSSWGSAWANEIYVQPTKTATKVGRYISQRMTTRTTDHALLLYSNTYFYERGGFI